MRVNRGIRVSMKKAVPVLINRQGIYADIYSPVRFNSLKHGYEDDDILYEKVPLTMKVLIPTYFKRGILNLEVLDPFNDDGDILMYVPLGLGLQVYSKVVTRTDSGVKNYIIESQDVYKDDSATLFSRYVLITSPSFDVERNLDELEGVLEKDIPLELEEGLEGNRVDVPLKGDAYQIDRII